MIFVTVGNAHNPFCRLLEAADQAAARTDEEYVVQSGYTPFEAKHAKTVPFLSIDEYDELVRQARIVVAHAGSGSIIAALTYGRPVIVMPRRKQYGEHVNDHQLEIAHALATEGRVRVVETAEQLLATLAEPVAMKCALTGTKPALLRTLEAWAERWGESRRRSPLRHDH